MMFIDDSILTSIKTQDGSDDEEKPAGLETIMDSDVKDIEVNINCNDGIEDPLYNHREMESNNKTFSWHCNENEFLFDMPIDIPKKSNSRPGKRARLDCEIKGYDGEIWTQDNEDKLKDDLPDIVPTGKGPAKLISSILEAWHLLLDTQILTIIVKSTNEVIKLKPKRESSDKRLTDLIEIRSWLGLNYLCGVLHNSGSIEEFWTLELGNAIFRATMSYKRFQFLEECISLTEQTTENNPLAEIESIWEKFVINCRSYYSPGTFCTVGQHTLDLRRPDKKTFDHTIRFITMCDAKTRFVCNALVTINDEPVDQEIYQLISDVKGTSRCICINDKSYTSLNLMQQIKEYQLQAIAALSPQSTFIPAQLRKLCEKDSQTWYIKSRSTSLIYEPEQKLSQSEFILTSALSSRINTTKLFQVTKDCNAKAISEMQKFSTQFGATGKNNHWTFEYLTFILDMAVHNAWILFRLSPNNDVNIEKRDFQRQLGLYLTQQQLKHRSRGNVKLPLQLKLQIAEILGEEADEVVEQGKTTVVKSSIVHVIPNEMELIPDGIVLQRKYNSTKRRCRACKTKNGSRGRTRCQQCLVPYCLRHLYSRCKKCTGYKGPEVVDSEKISDDINFEKEA